MAKLGYKKPFGIYKNVEEGEELIQKDGDSELRLIYFDIYNAVLDVLHIRINESDEVITLNPGEGYQMLEYPVYSCVCIDEGTVQASGLY